ncbi:Thymidylate kinase-like (plasmid) [Herpetosiphon aurantiacus DSM 785]|uniref:Thymidylate kinase-like n=1 Tax=Herpetosiphon aurantiacus (strain ATCC 23779 / DSM 785 / 114-95) TaxID=316274 RepID=A9B8Q6_HERA2|nr:Thymidylate kinase-like [Herpetosiphon aurantiacus DSM 785]
MASPSRSVTSAHRHRSPMIYITGSDGTGKTTQVHRLMEVLTAQGLPVIHRWLRFPFRLSGLLLVYARIRGLSWYEAHPYGRQGYWDFHASWLMQHVFPIVLWFDALSVAIQAVYWPISRGNIIVCERFVVDMLADLMVATQDFGLLKRWYARWFMRLLPARTLVILLDGDPVHIRQRRPDLAYDRVLSDRIRAVRIIAAQCGWPLIAADQSIDAIHQTICTFVEDCYVSA